MLVCVQHTFGVILRCQCIVLEKKFSVSIFNAETIKCKSKLDLIIETSKLFVCLLF